MFRGGRYSEVPPIKLVLIWDVWGTDWPLLTGGRCSEVVVNTGLTVNGKWSQHRSLEQKSFDLMIRSLDSDPSSTSHILMKLDFISQPSSKSTLPLKEHMQQCQVNFHSILLTCFLEQNSFDLMIRSLDSDPSSPSQSKVMFNSFGAHTMYDKDKI